METDAEQQQHHTSSLDIEINNQTILFSIKLLCKRIGEQNPLSFVRVIKFLSENLIDKTLYLRENNKSIQNVNLLSSVLLCIGEVCLKLKSNALVYLNQIMLFVLDIIDVIRAKLNDSETSDDLVDDFGAMNMDENSGRTLARQQFAATFKAHELLMISCVTCLVKIVQNLANFLSPYLTRLFYVSCALSYLTVKNDAITMSKNSQVMRPNFGILLILKI